MSTKMKGIYKSLKYLTQIFVVKEREIEIGYPTDVKHVAHIGWDGPSGSGPSWMSEFKTAPDFSTSLGNLDEIRDPSRLSTSTTHPQDNADSSPSSASKSKIKGTQPHDHLRAPKKHKRKKAKLASSKSSLSSSSSSKHSKAAKPTKNSYNEMEAPPPSVQV